MGMKFVWMVKRVAGEGASNREGHEGKRVGDVGHTRVGIIGRGTWKRG